MDDSSELKKLGEKYYSIDKGGDLFGGILAEVLTFSKLSDETSIKVFEHTLENVLMFLRLEGKHK